MERTYITTADGTELPMPAGTERDPNAKFHFAHQGTNSAGAQVWRCSEIQGRHLTHRLTFTAYVTDSSVRTYRTMGQMLFKQMLNHEAVAHWESNIAANGWQSHPAAA